MERDFIKKEQQASILLERVKAIRKRQSKLGVIKLRTKLRDELKECGRGFGRDKFFDLLRYHDLLVKRRRKYAVTTNSNHAFKKHENELAKINVTRPDEVWVSDITYLHTRSGFVYLSLVTDVYSRKIVGWDVNVSLAVEGSINAVKKAIRNCSDTKHLIHHSDRGIQYCCHAYTGLLEKNGIRISMGEAGNCYDNAIAERVNGILKNEYLLDNEFASYDQAVRATREAVYLYNYERPHWSLGLEIPADVYQNGYQKILAKTKKGSLKDAATLPSKRTAAASFKRD
jgi:transposase InsO family protein